MLIIIKLKMWILNKNDIKWHSPYINFYVPYWLLLGIFMIKKKELVIFQLKSFF
jgi:hypothetical protein